MERGRIPGAVVLVARDGKVVMVEAVGWADKDPKVKMTTDSIHPIASSTKLITTIAALRLFEANKIRVMAPIATYLPELKDLKVSVEKRDATGNATTELVTPARQPTVHDLMTHRAGFTYFFFPKNALRDRYRELGIDRVENMTADEMLQKLATLPLAYPPGTQFEYSIATDLLGHIVERVTGKPLDVALDELVLTPLKMKDTRFQVKGADVARLARPLSTDPDPWVFDWLDLARQPKRFSGGAGMASTVSDYFRPLQMLMNGGELDGVRLLLTCPLIVGQVATRPRCSSLGPRQVSLQRRHRYPDGIPDPEVLEFPLLAHPVDRRSAHAEKDCHLRDRKERLHPRANLGLRWHPVQQGSSKILAQACMGLHILAFLVGHTSRICTGLHVLARI